MRSIVFSAIVAATAALATAPATQAQSVPVFQCNPARPSGVGASGLGQQVTRDNSGLPLAQITGSLTYSGGIYEDFTVTPLAFETGFGGSADTEIRTYFLRHPDVDAVVWIPNLIVQGMPLNRRVNASFRSGTPHFYGSANPCDGDALPFSISAGTGRSGLVGLRFTGRHTNFRLTLFGCDSGTTYSSGHAFIEMSDGLQATRFGLSTYYYIPWTNGRITDESGTLYSETITWRLTAGQYDSASAMARTLANQVMVTHEKSYDIMTFNCTDYATEVCAAAGVEIPPYRNFLGQSCPTVLCANIRNAVLNNRGCFGTRHPFGLCTTSWTGVPTFAPNRYFPDPQKLMQKAATDPASVAQEISTTPTSSQAGGISAGKGRNVSISVSPAFPLWSGTSVNWGDGSAPSLGTSTNHVYTMPGTYTARAVTVDLAGVHVVNFPVTVTNTGNAAGANLVVPQRPMITNPRPCTATDGRLPPPRN